MARLPDKPSRIISPNGPGDVGLMIHVPGL